MQMAIVAVLEGLSLLKACLPNHLLPFLNGQISSDQLPLTGLPPPPSPFRPHRRLNRYSQILEYGLACPPSQAFPRLQQCARRTPRYRMCDTAIFIHDTLLYNGFINLSPRTDHLRLTLQAEPYSRIDSACGSSALPWKHQRSNSRILSFGVTRELS